MKITTTGRNLKVSDPMQASLEKKLSRLDKYFTEEVPVKATVSHIKTDVKVEITVPLHKTIIRAEGMHNEFDIALDEAINKLTGQIRKQKQKLMRKGHATIRFENFETDVSPLSAMGKFEEPKLIKRKKMEYTPMSEEEAILQMELLGHDFFIFNNAQTDSISVMYKRNDGNYGILEQE